MRLTSVVLVAAAVSSAASAPINVNKDVSTEHVRRADTDALHPRNALGVASLQERATPPVDFPMLLADVPKLSEEASEAATPSILALSGDLNNLKLSDKALPDVEMEAASFTHGASSSLPRSQVPEDRVSSRRRKLEDATLDELEQYVFAGGYTGPRSDIDSAYSSLTDRFRNLPTVFRRGPQGRMLYKKLQAVQTLIRRVPRARGRKRAAQRRLKPRATYQVDQPRS